MPLSMTSFARVEFDADYGRGAWELRSVNHRFAEVFVRLPDDFRSLEGAVLGGIVVGLLDAYGRWLAPDFSYFVLFGPMAILLLFRPTGLFGKEH